MAVRPALVRDSISRDRNRVSVHCDGPCGSYGGHGCFVARAAAGDFLRTDDSSASLDLWPASLLAFHHALEQCWNALLPPMPARVAPEIGVSTLVVVLCLFAVLAVVVNRGNATENRKAVRVRKYDGAAIGGERDYTTISLSNTSHGASHSCDGHSGSSHGSDCGGSDGGSSGH